MTINKLGMALVAATLLALAGCDTMGGPSNTSTSTSNDPGPATSGSAYSG